MRRTLKRALRITFVPDSEWPVISREVPRTSTLVIGFALPLATIPAVCCAVGLLIAGEGAAFGRTSGAMAPNEVARAGAVTLVGSVISLLVVAASLSMLAPLFGRPRQGLRALQVATYSSAPVFLAGFVLLIPNLSYALILAAMHSFYVLYGGAQAVMGIKAGRAAEYVALVIVLTVCGTTALGAWGSWLGLM